jgi:hypothetical protein
LTATTLPVTVAVLPLTEMMDCVPVDGVAVASGEAVTSGVAEVSGMVDVFGGTPLSAGGTMLPPLPAALHAANVAEARTNAKALEATGKENFFSSFIYMRNSFLSFVFSESGHRLDNRKRYGVKVRNAER